MNVGFLRWLLRDVDPETEVMLKLGDDYMYATDVDFNDLEKHDVVYIEANEY